MPVLVERDNSLATTTAQLLAEHSVVFSSRDTAGVIVSATLGALSSASVFLLLLHIFSVVLLPVLRRSHNEERVFLRMQLGIFIVCMLFSDLIQAGAVLIQTQWASRGGIDEGPMCTAQAALIQLGDNGTAVWNSVVAVQTFLTVVIGHRMTTTVVVLILVCGWLMIGILSLMGPLLFQTQEKGPFYGVAGLWCFIKDNYGAERVMLHYFPMMIAAATIFVCYLLVFLTLRGNLENDGVRWRIYWTPPSTKAIKRTVQHSKNSNQRLHLKALAKKMLWYPTVYIALIMPISMLRVNNVKDIQALLTGMCLLFCMGFSNVFIYCATRRIGPTPWFAHPVRESNKSVQIFVDRVTHDEVAPGQSILVIDDKLQDLDCITSLPKAHLPSSNTPRLLTSGIKGQGFVLVDTVGTFTDRSSGLVTFADTKDNDDEHNDDDNESYQSHTDSFIQPSPKKTSKPQPPLPRPHPPRPQPQPQTLPRPQRQIQQHQYQHRRAITLDWNLPDANSGLDLGQCSFLPDWGASSSRPSLSSTATTSTTTTTTTTDHPDHVDATAGKKARRRQSAET